MVKTFTEFFRSKCLFKNKILPALGLAVAPFVASTVAEATPFTTTVPNSSITLPTEYPEAGGVVMVYTGANGNIYYQFSNPAGAFRGFNSRGNPDRFEGNPFTINDPLQLDCGFSSCTDYFGGSIERLDIRFSAYDGDTQPNGFDEDDITLLLNGFDVGSWSGITTERTNTAGTVSQGFAIGFGNNTFNTAWFETTNQALLNNILTTGQVTTQVRDDDPNDNYWDFRRGNNLSNPSIVTVAPGYSLEKTADKATFAAVGETITYTYVVENVGSVPIRNLSVSDDKIANVTCDTDTINDVPFGSASPEFATCTGTYVVTQEDFDAQGVTNIASALGTPDFGVLGSLTDTVTVTGPATDPSISLDKTAVEAEFGEEGTVVNYNFTITNDGDTTLTDVEVTDPMLPGLSCSIAELLPITVDNTVNSFTCSGSYTVLQSDVDAWIISGTQLDNTAEVTATNPSGGTESDTAQVFLDGPDADVGLLLAKSALSLNYSAKDEVIDYQIELSNTGNVTFPAPPTITDSLGIPVTCPAGPVAPDTFITCEASYTVMQNDVDVGKIDNTVTTSITLGGVTANGSAQATVPAVQTTGLTLEKRLTSASPTSFDAAATDLFYEYELKNTGNVTLENIDVTDTVTEGSLDLPVTCSVTTLEPDDVVVCTSDAYSTTQTDLNNGSVENTASATSTAAVSGDVVDSNEDTVTVPADQEPDIALSKTAPTVDAADFVVGETITYTFTIENAGNIDITAATTGAAKITVTDDKIGTFDCLTLPFLRGTTRSCTADYDITQTDVEAGLVVNLATANAEDGTGASVVASNQAQATVAPNFNPSVSIEKTSDVATVDATTDVITYTFKVTNDGDAVLSLASNPISINDGKLASVDCSAQPALLNVGDFFNCTATYSPTQDELDAGVVENTATASFPFTNATSGATSTITSPSDDDTIDVVENLSMVFSKTPPASYTSVDELITYSFSAQNTSNVTLTTLVVTDSKIPALSCSFTDVAPTQTVTCTGQYQVTQLDIDEEEILNTASATGTSETGGSITETDTGDVDIAPAGIDNSLTISKTANKSEFTTLGEQITYTIEVTNTGTQTLLNTLVTDSLDPTFSCTIPSIAPNAQDETCTYVHTVTQDDFDAGKVDNLATAANPEVTSQTSGISIPGPTREADFTVTKTANTTFTDVGDMIDFTFTVKNTGNVRLNGVLVTDSSIFTPAETCSIGTLDPDVEDTSCVITYTVDQDDIDAGEINNTGTVTATGAEGSALSKDASATVEGPEEDASVSVDKASTDGVFAAPTDTEGYTFTVTNDGNVTLTNLVITDSDLGFTCSLADLAPGASTSVCADGTTALAATKSLDQDNVDDGSYVNEVTVEGESLVKGTEVDASDEETIVGPAQTVALSLVKGTTFVGNFDEVDQLITYQYTVTNDSNITLTSDVTVTDDKIPNVECDATPAAGVPPGGTISCTGEYEVTQDDLDTGNIFNTASASVTQPVVPANAGAPNVLTATSADATLNILATQNEVLSLDKRLKSTSLGTYQAKDDVVTYEYVVTNTGNVTITDDIVIFDDKFPTDLTCSTANLAPDGQIICEQTYTILQSDVNTGSVTNTAQAYTGTDLASATLKSNEDSVTVTAIQDPELTIAKVYVPEPAGDPADAFVSGEDLNYRFTITNTGNVTIALDPATVVNDNRITPFTCAGTPATLDPDESHQCTAVYVITDDDISLGSVTNIATANGTFGGDAVVSQTANAIFPVDADPALSIEKLADVTTFDEVGDKIVYTYNVTNTGNTDLASPGTVTDDKFPGTTLTCVDPTGGVFRRLADAPAEIATCTQEYSVTQDDLDAGFVTNEAFALTTFGVLPVQSPAAVVTVTPDDSELSSTIELTKSVTPTDDADLNDTLTYTLTASASGNQRVFGVEITDPLIGTLTCTQGGSSVTTADLEPGGDPLICTGQLTVTQEMLDDQEVLNTAGARGSAPDGSVVTVETQNSLPTVDAEPLLEITKRISPEPTSAGDPAYATFDQDVTFVVTVKNVGNITLNNVNVTDDLVAGTCAVGTLSPGDEDDSCEFVITTTQQHVDDGSIVNTATAAFEPASGGSDSVSDDVTAFGPEREPAFALNKTADVSEFTKQGDIITYSYVVANAGNVTLFDQPVIVDDKIGTFNCSSIPATGLAPLDNIICTRPYEVTQDDVDAGFVTNIATVNSADVPEAAEATETVDAVRSPGVSLTKVAIIPDGKTQADADDTITYQYTVTNTGNVTLTNLDVDDSHTSSAGTIAMTIAGDSLSVDNGLLNDSTDGGANGVWDSLAPLDVVTFTSTYLVTQADIDSGADLSNTATVSGAGPPGVDPVEDEVTITTPVATPDPKIEARKTVASFTGSEEDDTITYRIEIENTGNVTLSNINLTDTLTRVDGTPLSVTTGPDLDASTDTQTAGKLDVDEIWVYEATYILTQADIDAGGVNNQVLAVGTAPNGASTSDQSGNGLTGGDNSPTPFIIPADPSIEATKIITSTTVLVGETVSFKITVKNTGNVTLTGVGIQSDTLTRSDTANTELSLATGPTFSGSTENSPVGTLIPGESATYTATYVLTQEDVDAGGISNTATAQGTPPIGSFITDVSDDGNPADGTDNPTVLTIPADPSLALVKQLADGQDPNFDTLDEVINYAFVVTNTGNVSLPGPFTINDAKITDQGNTITCPTPDAPGLAPDGTLTCTGSYTVTQDDLDAGEFMNSATVDDGVSPTSDPSEFTIPAIQKPAMELAKVAEDLPAEDFVIGKVVTYTYTVTNTGNVTLEDEITITDNLIPAEDFTCPDFPTDGIAPEGTYECTAEYTVSSNDVFLGSVTNLASASDGTTTSPQTSETIPNEGEPLLEIEKTAEDGAAFAEVGDEIEYTFVVTNKGTRAFARDVVVADSILDDDIVCFDASGGDSFNAGATATCSGTYTVDQDDLDRGDVFNEATASTEFSRNGETTTVVSAPDDVTVDATEEPALSIVKTATPSPITVVGEVVTYNIVVTNTGNQTLNTIRVSDPLLPDLVCEAETLARGATLNCSDTYTVLQSDIDEGELVNTATVTGQSPTGEPVDAKTSITTAVPDADPSVAISKAASPPTLGPVGSLVTYTMTVENTGNVTLEDLVVTDVLDSSFSCDIASLAPDLTDSTCSFELEVTQDMVDNGGVENTASVEGTDPNDTVVSGEDTIFTDGPTRAPSLEATKVASVVGTAVGQVVGYTLNVENTGNVTLDVGTITDTMVRRNGAPTQLDAPFTFISGDTDDDGLLDVDETWVYEAEHTITQSDVNGGGFNNTVTVEATGPDDSDVFDVSDDGDDGDGNSADDTTEVAITSDPSMKVTKTITQTGAIAGDVVKFVIEAINTGNVDITISSLPVDTLTRADGTILLPVGPTRLTGGTDDGDDQLETAETLRWEVSYELVQEDIDALGISNTATLSGTAPNGDPVSDVSDDGDNSDGNLNDDATMLVITPVPSITSTKTVSASGSAVDDVVEFTLTVVNNGNVTLSNVALTDQLTRNDGTELTITGPTFDEASLGSGEGTLLPNEVATYIATYTLVQEDLDEGGISNTATATGTTPQGAVLTDVSDDPNAATDTGPSDPAVVEITRTPSILLTKEVTSSRALFPTIREVIFTIKAENDGNVTQENIQIADDLNAFAAPAEILSASVATTGFTDGLPNGAYTGTGQNELLSGTPSLLPGEVGTVLLTVTYSTLNGLPENGVNTVVGTSTQLTASVSGTALVTGGDTDGDGTDDSNEGCTAADDRDGDGICDAEDYDPTGYFYCEEDGRILTGGLVTISGNGFTQTGVGTTGSIRVLQDGTSGFYQFDVTAPGTYTIAYTNPTDGIPSTTRLATTAPTPISSMVDVLAGTTTTDPRILGSGETGSTGFMADFSAAANPVFYTSFVISAGDPNVFSNNLAFQACTTPGALEARKSVIGQTDVRIGDIVNYQLEFELDATGGGISNATIVDLLPTGIVYQPGSAMISLNGGAATAVEPTVAGRQLTWTGQNIPVNSTLQVLFTGRVAPNAPVGELTNTTYMTDAAGARLSNTATADVRRVPEHVFDCSDVIGKVFDDKNHNGYHDQGEPGIPNARVVTVRGTRITTDEFGRFHVPCAELPSNIGTNFSLKLDPRSLPTGYRVTTENPRVERLTAGKFAKINFGASISNVIRIELNERAFTQDGQMTAGFERAVQGMVSKFKDRPSVVRLTYLRDGRIPPALARQRLKTAEKMIKEEWRKRGQFKLNIERTIKLRK